MCDCVVRGCSAGVVTGGLLARTASAQPREARGGLTFEVYKDRGDEFRWRLKADQALMYDQAGLTQLRKLTANIFQKERAWTIVGEEGELDRTSNNVEVRKNVIVTSDDGVRLETSVLRWDAQEKRLWTDAPVRLSRDGSTVSGSGLSVLMEDESTTVTGRVRATFLAGKKR